MSHSCQPQAWGLEVSPTPNFPNSMLELTGKMGGDQEREEAEGPAGALALLPFPG